MVVSTGGTDPSVYFTTTAADPSGAKSTQRWGVAVKAANNIPVINSTAPTSVVIGQNYRYDVNASDVDNDPLTYSLVNAPSGMTIDANGRVEWSTTTVTTGTYAVRIAVTDGRSAPVEQPYNLTVTPDSVAPTVQIVTDRSIVRIGETVGIQVYAIDNIAVASRTLTLTTRSYLGTTNTINHALPLLANGTIQLKIEADMFGAGINAFGELSFAATATDGAGNVGTATPVSITVPNPDDQKPPVADILNNDQNTISEPIDIIGTVSDDLAGVTWKLTLNPNDGGTVKTLATGNGPVSNAVLAKLDTTLLRNGVYTVTLTAKDVGTNETSDSISVTIEGGLKMGNFTMTFKDLEIPLAGVPITITRTYDSLDADVSQDFGYGWSMDTYTSMAIVTERVARAAGYRSIGIQRGLRLKPESKSSLET